MDKLLHTLHNMHIPPTTVMEVCGTHTNAIARYGLRELLPPGMRLISGPGCPVCVTDGTDLFAALFLARTPGVVVYSFGDMLRIPVAGDSLLHARELGADVRIATSPMDALKAALSEPDKQIVWLGVGFETTAPMTAALLMRAREADVHNISVLCAHKAMPAALLSLLQNNRRVDALLCPGHVSTIIGAEGFRFVPEVLHMPAVVAGFEPHEVLAALLQIARMRERGEAGLENCYPAAVTAGGNPAAGMLLETVFELASARWRGLGEIEGSGFRLRGEFAEFDARKRFELPEPSPAQDTRGCRCADLLRGEAQPHECPLFGRTCTPEHPAGPCMVSSEGACAATYQYGGI